MGHDPPRTAVADVAVAAPRCPVCGDLTASEPVVVCESCETPHHERCWAYSKTCSTFGCESRTFLEGPAQEEVSRRELGGPVVFERRPGNVVWLVSTALVACGWFALWWSGHPALQRGRHFAEALLIAFCILNLGVLGFVAFTVQVRIEEGASHVVRITRLLGLPIWSERRWIPSDAVREIARDVTRKVADGTTVTGERVFLVDRGGRRHFLGGGVTVSGADGRSEFESDAQIRERATAAARHLDVPVRLRDPERGRALEAAWPKLPGSS